MKRVTANSLIITGCVLGAGLLYFLSIGPLLKLATDTHVEAMADKFYSPLLDSGETPVWPIVRRYLRLWGLYHPIEDSTRLPKPK